MKLIYFSLICVSFGAVLSDVDRSIKDLVENLVNGIKTDTAKVKKGQEENKKDLQSGERGTSVGKFLNFNIYDWIFNEKRVDFAYEGELLLFFSSKAFTPNA